LDRLTSASHPLLVTPQSFAYDPVGNRTTGGSIVNAGNQLTADANYGYEYDDNGNLTRKTSLATGNYTQYTYDAENRLTTVDEFAAGNPTAAFTSTYRYDGLGRRIEKVANGQTTRYIYDGEDILLESDGSNVLQARYTHGPGIDEPIAVTKGGATYFYHQDGLGSVTDLTDSTGATAKSYAYDAYGNIVDQTGTIEQPYTYTGREFDAESGLYYYRARYYDPATGRFLQKDPIGLRGGINLYRYVGGNPIRFRDPYGLENPQCEGIRRAINSLEEMLQTPRQCPDPVGFLIELNRLRERYDLLGCDDGGDDGGGHTVDSTPNSPEPSDQERQLKQAARIAVATAVAVIITIITKIPIPIPF